MADISKIKAINGTTYTLKDTTARNKTNQSYVWNVGDTSITTPNFVTLRQSGSATARALSLVYTVGTTSANTIYTLINTNGSKNFVYPSDLSYTTLGSSVNGAAFTISSSTINKYKTVLIYCTKSGNIISEMIFSAALTGSNYTHFLGSTVTGVATIGFLVQLSTKVASGTVTVTPVYSFLNSANSDLTSLNTYVVGRDLN